MSKKKADAGASKEKNKMQKLEKEYIQGENIMDDLREKNLDLYKHLVQFQAKDRKRQQLVSSNLIQKDNDDSDATIDSDESSKDN